MSNPYKHMAVNLILEAEEGINTDDDEAVISFLSDGESEKIDEDDDDLDEVIDEEEDDL